MAARFINEFRINTTARFGTIVFNVFVSRNWSVIKNHTSTRYFVRALYNGCFNIINIRCYKFLNLGVPSRFMKSKPLFMHLIFKICFLWSHGLSILGKNWCCFNDQIPFIHGDTFFVDWVKMWNMYGTQSTRKIFARLGYIPKKRP